MKSQNILLLLLLLLLAAAVAAAALVTPRPSSLYKPKLHALPNFSLMLWGRYVPQVRVTVRRYRSCPWSHRRGLVTFSCSMVYQNCREESSLPEGSYVVRRRKWCHTSMRIRERRLARDWDAMLCIA